MPTKRFSLYAPSGLLKHHKSLGHGAECLKWSWRLKKSSFHHVLLSHLLLFPLLNSPSTSLTGLTTILPEEPQDGSTAGVYNMNHGNVRLKCHGIPHALNQTAGSAHRSNKKTIYFGPGMLFLFLLWAVEWGFLSLKAFAAVFKEYYCLEEKKLISLIRCTAFRDVQGPQTNSFDFQAFWFYPTHLWNVSLADLRGFECKIMWNHWDLTDSTKE